MSAGKVAFVAPRFGPKVVGGAEAVVREVAVGLAQRDWDVEVFTTCAVNHYTWENDLREGTTLEEGVKVHRFKNVHSRSPHALKVHYRICGGETPSLDDQVSWLNFPFRVPGLFEALGQVGSSFDAVIFAPYLFWTTTVCMPLVSANAIVMPCLHDEVYARLDVVRHVLEEPAGIWFLSEPEHQLAHRLGPVAEHHVVTGAGVDVPGSHDPERFRRRHGIEGPFVLYAGRRERDKGWDWLLELYEEAASSGVKLVTVGVGEVEVPASLQGHVIDLGFVDETERNDAFAAASATVQPSLMESFSRSVMESWLANTPVLVRRGSEVVEWHLERCGGGAVFADGSELAGHLKTLRSDPYSGERMGESGRRYVIDTYSWPVVLDRMEADLQRMKERVSR